ncbi:Fe-S cluster assembly protein SufD [Microbacterium lacticum]|uniref:Iron-regulated ABC transporter permease protein SufD n=1 Tax=Microbacterium lacticum TaxID=33885 RepID=A0A4Y3UGX5_9MICO|nr:Fe-S cluster assembly protein SufD [Microbacterium lacticum]TQN00184.1 iron-regulated ABC transporter permease protein SufD [Microbacterium lacticum]GEB93886.1 Fe-S cluster assembly protein SufD [Microbacterium lacticum]GGN10990.1 Fe-S cluster assembly protein SufD [Microbacterium lacticum]
MTTATQTPASSGQERTEGHLDPAARLTGVRQPGIPDSNEFVPVQTRSERPTSFDPADFGTPVGTEVNWKHTPLKAIAELLRDEPAPHDVIGVEVSAPDAVEQGRLAVGEAPRGEVFRPEDLPSAIAWHQEAEAPLIRIPQGVELDEPIVVRLTGRGGVAHAHVVIEAQPHSRGTVILRHEGTAQQAQNVEIIVRDGAALTLVSVQRWDDDAVHLASHQARVDRDAALTHVVVSLGGGLVRVNPSVELAGAGADGKLYGLAFSDSGQHLESQVYLHHKGPHTIGDVLYKAALQGAGARTVWIGDVLIGPDATGTDSYEANRNLVLTEGARADSIPNLEIETGDIIGAGHASATGRFDDEQLFYLQARGIAEDEARRLVVLGFLAEIVQKIGIDDLQSELIEAIEAELALTASVSAEASA